MSDGYLSRAGSESESHDLASIADFYDMKALTISEEDGDVVIETKYGTGFELKEICNNTAQAGDIIVRTIREHLADGTTDITLKLNAYQRSGRLPKIYSLTKTGTMDGLLLFLQKR